VCLAESIYRSPGMRHGKLDGKGSCARSGAGFGPVVYSGFWNMRTEVKLVQELAAITNIFEYAAQGCFEGERPSRSDFGLDLRPVFHFAANRNRREKTTYRRRTFREERGSNRFLGGSDPTLSGFSAATPLAPGVATAQIVQQIFSLRRRQSCRRNG
jgi:hypothetical protein